MSITEFLLYEPSPNATVFGSGSCVVLYIMSLCAIVAVDYISFAVYCKLHKMYNYEAPIGKRIRSLHRKARC